MALVVGVNSYASVADANTYFEDRLDVAAWSDATDTNKSMAMVTATSLLDNLDWIGSVADSTQSLAHPRIGMYNDPRLGITIDLADVGIDRRVVTACYELAYHLLNNEGLLDDTGLVKSVSLGQIGLQTIIPPNKMSGTVRRLIKPLLLRGGSRSWWRVN